MTWVNGRIAASVGTADSYVSFPILYLFIFRKTLVAKIRIIFTLIPQHYNLTLFISS